MHKEKILILILAGFGAGIAIRSFFEMGWPHAVLAGLLSLVGFVLWKLRKKELFAATAFFLLAFGFGVLRYDIKDQDGISENLEQFIGETMIIRGVVADEPDERENSTQLIIEVSEILNWQTKGWAKAENNRILVFAPRYPEFKYGDILQIRGKLQKPENFIKGSPSTKLLSTRLEALESGAIETFEKSFDWENYLAKDDIFLQMFYPTIRKLEVGSEGLDVSNWRLDKRILFAIKNQYLESLGRVLPEPHAALVGGLTVGAKRAMPKELLEDFRKVGVIHIVVLSGYNITIIARSIAAFFSLFMPWLAGIVTGIVGIVAFAILAGGSATVVRASIMAVLIYFARMTGNVYRAAIALFVAGFFMLIQNPKLLRFDASFQLSFLATLGLIYIAPKIERYLKFIPKKFNFREAAVATVSAQIAVTPFILHNMGALSLVALPVNVLILLTVPAAMLFGALAGVVGMVSSLLAIPFAWTAYVILEYELRVVDFFAKLRLAEIKFDYFPLTIVVALYAIIIWLVFIKKPASTNVLSNFINWWRLRGWKVESE